MQVICDCGKECGADLSATRHPLGGNYSLPPLCYVFRCARCRRAYVLDASAALASAQAEAQEERPRDLSRVVQGQ